MLPVAPSLSEGEETVVLFRLTSIAARLSWLTVRQRVRGNSLHGAQLAHSLRRERRRDFLGSFGLMSSMARPSAPQTGASISVVAAGATTSSRTTPADRRTHVFQMACL